MTHRLGIALSLCALVALVPACGDDDPCGCGDDPGGLVFSREDGSPISFPPDAGTFVWCGDWETGRVPEPTLHIALSSATPDTPGWRLKVVLADAAVGDTLFIPNTFVWDQPDSLDFFLLDPPNELSSQQQESSGFLVFQQLGCGQTIEFDLDAVLASEIAGQPSVTVRGRFRGTYTGIPSQ